jgi:hypothetical protein
MQELPFVVTTKEEAQAYFSYRRKVAKLERYFLAWVNWVSREVGPPRKDALELILGLAYDELQ